MSEAVHDPIAQPLRRFKPYPAYKDCGVEWLGDVPVEWLVVPLKRRLTSIKDGTHGSFERVFEGVPLLSAKNIGVDGQLQVSSAESLVSLSDYEQINRNGYLKRGDLLLTIVGTIGRAAVFDHPEPVAFQRSVAVLRPTDTLSVRFLFYQSQGESFQHALQNSSKQSAQGGVYLSDVAELPIVCPPVSEQRAIAAFLDRETAKVDALVAKKDRLIELLQEKRTALITRAVTKGLDPHVPMKDSGVEWLGEIPAHWEVKRLKHLATINPESLTENTDPTFEMVYVDIGGVDSLGRIVEREQLTFATAPSRARRLVRDGDVIVSTVRTYLRAIAPIIEPEPGMIVSTGFAVVRPADGLKTAYAAYALRAPYFVERVVANSKGVSFPAINESEMATYELAVPPETEQRAIAAFLDRETAKIDALIAKVREGIERLKEYRTALISAAVTGKIDVREEEK